MTDDEQRLESAENVRNAIIDCIGVLRKEQKKNYNGKWDEHIDDLASDMMDGVCNICGLLKAGIDEEYFEEYERQTGHELGVYQGRV